LYTELEAFIRACGQDCWQRFGCQWELRGIGPCFGFVWAWRLVSLAKLGQLFFFDAKADNEVTHENGAPGSFGEREARLLPSLQGSLGDMKGGRVCRKRPREDPAAIAVAADTSPYCTRPACGRCCSRCYRTPESVGSVDN
jgi:hypothetical protein